MTLQNPSSCQARPVPAHCAIFVLVCREMSRTGAEIIILDFAWTLWPRWPQERLVKTRVVSGFIFLRLLCPAILNPRQVWKKYYFYDRLPWDQKTSLDTTLKTFTAILDNCWACSATSHVTLSLYYWRKQFVNLFAVWASLWACSSTGNALPCYDCQVPPGTRRWHIF